MSDILRLKCTKFDFGWGSAPDPAGGAYSAPPDPYLDLMSLLLRGGRGRGEKGREGRGREREGKGRAREGRGVQCVPYFSCCLLATLTTKSRLFVAAGVYDSSSM